MRASAAGVFGMFWTEVERHPPPDYLNVLLAFEEHWNQVVGFRSKDEFWETSAHDHNSRIVGKKPKWWRFVPQVPHYPDVTLGPRDTLLEEAANGGEHGGY